jgi:hypothetical protein
VQGAKIPVQEAKMLLSDPFCASIKGELEEVERITNFEN